MNRRVSNRGQRRPRTSLATAGLVAASLASCTSLLGIDGTYRGEEGEGAGGAGTTSTGSEPTVVASVSSSSSSTTGSGGSPATTATTSTGAGAGGEGPGGGGGAGGGEFEGLPPCDGPNIDFARFEGEDEHLLLPFSDAPSGVRMRLGDSGFTAAWEVGLRAAVYRNGFIGLDLPFSEPIPFEVGSYSAAGRGSAGVLLMGPGTTTTVSATAQADAVTRLLDAKPVSADSMRILVERQGVIEDFAWQIGTDFGLFDLPRDFGCQPRAIAYVEHGGDDAVFVCDGSLGVTSSAMTTPAEGVQAIAAVRSGADDWAVSVEDGLYVRRHSPEGWLPRQPLEAAEALSADDHPALARLPDGVMVVWTRRVGGDRQLAAARCRPDDCCALPLHEQMERTPGLEAEERWGAAIAAPEADEPSLVFAADLVGSSYGVFGAKLEFVSLPGAAATP